MENSNRACGSCKTVLTLFFYRKEHKTCNICLEKARINYANNRDVMLQRSKDYRLKNSEKEKERHRLYNSNHKEELKEKRREYQHLQYYCPVCLYIVKLYKKHQHCKSLIHVNNLKYCDEQKQICILNSRIEHNILHSNIDEEVKQLVDEDIKNNIIQQSLFDAIRNFNMKIENAMNEK